MQSDTKDTAIQKSTKPGTAVRARDPQRAIERAQHQWSQGGTRMCETAYFVRGKLRAQGVKGELRLLKDYAAGDRGKASESQLRNFVRFACEHGMSEPDAQLQLRQLADGIVADVYRESRSRHTRRSA